MPKIFRSATEQSAVNLRYFIRNSKNIIIIRGHKRYTWNIESARCQIGTEKEIHISVLETLERSWKTQQSLWWFSGHFFEQNAEIILFHSQHLQSRWVWVRFPWSSAAERSAKPKIIFNRWAITLEFRKTIVREWNEFRQRERIIASRICSFSPRSSRILTNS